MKFTNYKKIISTVVLASFILYPMLNADDLSFGMGDRSSSDSKIPTVVTADSMDMDLINKLIILEGNVVVNDGQVIIHADKIDIYLKKTPAKSKDSKDQKKNKGDSMTSEAGAQQVDKIIALGHVVIERILQEIDGRTQPRQKAVGGKAVYNTTNNTIVLTKNPMLIYGDGSYTKGNKITLWRDSDRLKVEGNRGAGQMSKLVLAPQDQQGLEGNNPEYEKKKVEEESDSTDDKQLEENNSVI